MDLTGEVVVTTTAAATTTTLPIRSQVHQVVFSLSLKIRLTKPQKNTTTSTSGQADKKPCASGRVFAITEGQAANTSGMDWLIEHHAMIDCHSYRVIFVDIHAPEYTYHGSLSRKPMQIISALQA
nr:reverse transcriptase domain-containing protein [Tanacetum cinerariifolium]